MSKINKIYFVVKNKIEQAKDLIKQDTGMGTVEVILIIVVLIGLVIIFKDQISGLVESVFESINSKSSEVTS